MIWALVAAMANDPQPGPGGSVIPKTEYAAAARLFGTLAWPRVRKSRQNSSVSCPGGAFELIGLPPRQGYRADAISLPRPAVVAIAGGVAANGVLRERITEWGKARGVIVRVPEKRYCTDNAAMIAFAGLQKGEGSDPRRVSAHSRIG